MAKLQSPLDAALDALARGRSADPFGLLGPHVLGPPDGGRGVVIRAWLPAAEHVEVVRLGAGAPVRMRRRHPEGIHEAVFEHEPAIFDYRLRVAFPGGRTIEIDDPYRFGLLLQPVDIHLLCEGTHLEAYKAMGAHCRTIEGVSGVVFTVWAPNARRVSVVGAFNRWDGRVHGMRLRLRWVPKL